MKVPDVRSQQLQVVIHFHNTPAKLPRLKNNFDLFSLNQAGLKCLGFFSSILFVSASHFINKVLTCRIMSTLLPYSKYLNLLPNSNSWHIYHHISLIWEKSCSVTHNIIFCFQTPCSSVALKLPSVLPHFPKGSLIWITRFACQPLVCRPEDTEQWRLVQSDRAKKENLYFLYRAVGSTAIIERQHTLKTDMSE